MAALLEAKHVTKVFGGLVAVDDVDMDIEQGDIYGIIEPNGAGKTTFFNLCSGFYAPSSGSICLGGERISGLPTALPVWESPGLFRIYSRSAI